MTEKRVMAMVALALVLVTALSLAVAPLGNVVTSADVVVNNSAASETAQIGGNDPLAYKGVNSLVGTLISWNGEGGGYTTLRQNKVSSQWQVANNGFVVHGASGDATMPENWYLKKNDNLSAIKLIAAKNITNIVSGTTVSNSDSGKGYAGHLKSSVTFNSITTGIFNGVSQSYFSLKGSNYNMAQTWAQAMLAASIYSNAGIYNNADFGGEAAEGESSENWELQNGFPHTESGAVNWKAQYGAAFNSNAKTGSAAPDLYNYIAIKLEDDWIATDVTGTVNLAHVTTAGAFPDGTRSEVLPESGTKNSTQLYLGTTFNVDADGKGVNGYDSVYNSQVTKQQFTFCPSGEGFSFGRLAIPDFTYVVLDLNGHTIDRNLINDLENELTNVQSVFMLGRYSRLEVFDSSANGTSNPYGSGKVTGGYTTSDGTVTQDGKERSYGSDSTFCNSVKGGGFTLRNRAELTLHSGNITGNRALFGGAFYGIGNSTVNILDAAITDNSAIRGGGTYLSQSSYMVTNVFGGLLSGNCAYATGLQGVGSDTNPDGYSTYGGAICVYQNAFCNVYGGSFRYNFSSQYGGAISISNNSFLKLFGGEIRDNVAKGRIRDIHKNDGTAIATDVNVGGAGINMFQDSAGIYLNGPARVQGNYAINKDPQDNAYNTAGISALLNSAGDDEKQASNLYLSLTVSVSRYTWKTNQYLENGTEGSSYPDIVGTWDTTYSPDITEEQKKEENGYKFARLGQMYFNETQHLYPEIKVQGNLYRDETHFAQVSVTPAAGIEAGGYIMRDFFYWGWSDASSDQVQANTGAYNGDDGAGGTTPKPRALGYMNGTWQSEANHAKEQIAQDGSYRFNQFKYLSTTDGATSGYIDGFLFTDAGTALVGGSGNNAGWIVALGTKDDSNLPVTWQYYDPTSDETGAVRGWTDAVLNEDNTTGFSLIYNGADRKYDVRVRLDRTKLGSSSDATAKYFYLYYDYFTVFNVVDDKDVEGFDSQDKSHLEDGKPKQYHYLNSDGHTFANLLTIEVGRDEHGENQTVTEAKYVSERYDQRLGYRFIINEDVKNLSNDTAGDVGTPFTSGDDFNAMPPYATMEITRATLMIAQLSFSEVERIYDGTTDVYISDELISQGSLTGTASSDTYSLKLSFHKDASDPKNKEGFVHGVLNSPNAGEQLLTLYVDIAEVGREYNGETDSHDKHDNRTLPDRCILANYVVYDQNTSTTINAEEKTGIPISLNIEVKPKVIEVVRDTGGSYSEKNNRYEFEYNGETHVPEFLYIDEDGWTDEEHYTDGSGFVYIDGERDDVRFSYSGGRTAANADKDGNIFESSSAYTTRVTFTGASANNYTMHVEGSLSEPTTYSETTFIIKQKELTVKSWILANSNVVEWDMSSSGDGADTYTVTPDGAAATATFYYNASTPAASYGSDQSVITVDFEGVVSADPAIGTGSIRLNFDGYKGFKPSTELVKVSVSLSDSKGNYYIESDAETNQLHITIAKRPIAITILQTANELTDVFGFTAGSVKISAADYWSYADGSLTLIASDIVSNFANISASVDWGSHFYKDVYPETGYYPVKFAISASGTEDRSDCYELTITGGAYKGFGNSDSEDVKSGVFRVTNATITFRGNLNEAGEYGIDRQYDFGIDETESNWTFAGGIKYADADVTVTYSDYKENGEVKSDSLLPQKGKPTKVSVAGVYTVTVTVVAPNHDTATYEYTFTVSEKVVTVQILKNWETVYGTTMPTKEEILAWLSNSQNATLTGTEKTWSQLSDALDIRINNGGNSEALSGIQPVGSYTIYIASTDTSIVLSIDDNNTNINRYVITPLPVTVEWVAEKYNDTHDDVHQFGTAQIGGESVQIEWWWSTESISGSAEGVRVFHLRYIGRVFTDFSAEDNIWTPHVTNAVNDDALQVFSWLLEFNNLGTPTLSQINEAVSVRSEETLTAAFPKVAYPRNVGWYLLKYGDNNGTLGSVNNDNVHVNYGDPQQNNQWLLVKVEQAQADLSWQADSLTVTYNGTAQTPALSAKSTNAVDSGNSRYWQDGLLGTDVDEDWLSAVTFSFTMGETKPTNAINAGTYQVALNYDSLNELFLRNYALVKDGHQSDGTPNNAEFTIKQATITLSDVAAQQRAYNGEVAANLEWTLSGVVDVDADNAGRLSIVFEAAFEDKHAGEAKTVSYTFTLSGTSAANYVLAMDGASWDNGARKLTGTVEGTITRAKVAAYGITVQEKTYNGKTDVNKFDTDSVQWYLPDANRKGLYDGDNLTLTVDGAYTNRNAAQGTGIVSISEMSIGGDSVGDYELVFNSDLTVSNELDVTKINSSQTRIIGLTVNKAKLTVNGGFSVQDKLYDGYNSASVSYVDGTDIRGEYLDGLCKNGDVFDDVQVVVMAQFGSKNVLYSGEEIAKYTYKGKDKNGSDCLILTFSISGDDSGNYELEAEPYSGENVEAQITRRTLSVFMTATDKRYDGTTKANVTVTLSGFISGEDDFLTTDTSGIEAQFNNKNVGQSKTVTAAITYAIVKDKADHAGASKNYYFEDTSLVASANITPIVLEISTKAEFTDREYDGTTIATLNNLEAISEAVLSGIIREDEVSLNVTGIYNSKDVATANNITVTYTLTGADAGNYTLVDNHGTTVTTTWKDPDNTAGKILPKKVDVQWNEQEFTYSGKDHKFDLTKLAYYTTIDIDGGTRVYLQVASYDKDGGSATDFVNAGEYMLKLVQADGKYQQYRGNVAEALDSNYELQETLSHNYTITQAQVAANLGVTIQDWSDDGTKYQEGSTYAGNTYTNRYTGTQHTLLVNFVATGGGVTPKGEHESGTWEIVGNKAIVKYFNYTVTIEFTASADGKFNDTTRVQAAGTYTLTIALNTAIDGNFDLINGTEFVYTITPATIVGSVDSISSSYDPDSNYEVNTPEASNFSSELQTTYGFSGYVFNPTVKITSVTGVVADEYGNYKLSQVGTYTVYYTVTATDHNPLSGSFTVTVSNTSIYIDISSAEAITKVYGITDDDLLAAFWELVKTCKITTTSKDHPVNDKDQAVDWLQKHVTVSFQGESRSTAELLAVGSYRVNLSATNEEDAGVSVQFRYNSGSSVTSQIALVSITPKLVHASGATFSEKVYDGNVAAIVSTVGSFGADEIVESDDVTLSASGVYNSANVSEASQITVTYTMSGADANNYTFDDKDGATVKTTRATVADQKITPKSVTVHWNDKSFTYSGKTPDFDLTKLAYYLTVDNKQVYLVVYVQGKEDASTFVNNGEYTLEVGSQQYGESGAEAFSSNYTLENNTHNYTINKATITVSGMTVTSKVYDRTDECPIENVTKYLFAGLFDEETPTLLKAVFDGVTAGGHNVTVYIQLPSDNYTLSGSREVVSGSVEGVKGDNLCSVTVFGTIDRKQLTVKGGFTVEDKVYDGNPTALVKYDDDKSTAVTGSTNLSGLVGSDDVKVTVTARFASANVLYSGSDVAAYTYKNTSSTDDDSLSLTFVLFGSDSGNYVLTAEPYSGKTVSATITRRTLNVSMTADSRTYNGKDDATVHVTLSGFISGEDNYLTTDTSDIVAHFNNKNVGQSKTVTATITYAVVKDAAEHAGASKNYYFEATSLVASANVTPIVLDVSVKATFTDDREYDGTQNATPNNLEAITGAVLAKKIDGDTVNLNVTGVYNSKDVATANNITVTYTLTGADAGNYTLVDNHNTTVTTTWVDDTPTAGKILPKKVDVQWSEQEFTYSGKDHEFDLTKLAYYTTIDIDGGTRVYLQVASYDKDGGSATDFVNAGEYMLKLVQADSKYQQYRDGVAEALDSNYELQGTLNHNYTIKQAEVTLTVTVPSKVYDGTDACDKNKVVVSGKSGLFDGDLETVIKAVFKNVVVGRQNVEVYIELGANYRLGGDANLDTGDYKGQNVYVVTTTAEITKATLTITGGFTVEDKVYDGNTTALVKYTNTDVTAVTGEDLSGLFSQAGVLDDVSVTVTARFASANVWYSGAAVAPYTYKGQKSNAADRLELTFVLFGEDSGNYELDVENPYTGETVSATITRRTLTPSMTASDKEYNGDDIADIEIKLNGFIQGEESYLTVDLTGIEAHFDSKNVGQNKSVTVFFTYDIVKDAAGRDGASKNYYFEATSLVASADINPIVLKIGTKATFIDREYDGTQNATPNNLEAIRKAVLSGIIHDDEVSLDVTGEYNTKNVATANKITVTYTLTGADAGNYTLVDNGGTKVTTKWEDPEKTTGQILPKQVELHWNDQEFTYRGQTPNFDLTKLAYYTTIENDGSRTVYLKVATYNQGGTEKKAFVDAGTYTLKLADESGYIEYLAGGGEVALNSNYAFVEATTHEYTIKQAEVTLTVAVLSKVYDGTDLCEKDNVSISGRSGLFDEDLETVIKAVFKGVAVGRQNVEVYIKLGVNYRLGGDANLDTGDYNGQNVYVVTVASEITSKEVSVEWTIDGGSLVYNGTDQLGSIHASWEDVDGDKNTLGFKITTFNDAPYGLTTALHAGVYKVVADELDPEFAANYKLVNTEFSFTINKAKVKVVGIKVLNKEFDNNIIATVDISGVKFEIENQVELAVNELGLYGTDSLNVLASGVFDEPDIGTEHKVTVNVTLYGASVADYELADGQAVQTFENVVISSRVWIVDTNYGDEGSGWRWTKKGNTYEVELGIMQESNNAIKDVIKMAGESGVGGIVLTAHTKTDATCTADGEIYFTATATYGSTTFSYEPGVKNYSEKTAIVPAFGHTWVLDTGKGTDGWTWSHDGGHTAQVHIVCETCGTEHALSATVDSPRYSAECTRDVYVTYTAIVRIYVQSQGDPFTVNDTIEGETQHTYTSSDVVTVPYTGHDWRIDTTDAADSDGDGWTWSEDFTRATVHFICNNCGEQHSTYTTSSIVNIPVGCENDGMDEATVTVTREAIVALLQRTDRDTFVFILDESLTARRTFNVVLATGHNWGEPVWNWQLEADGYSATATFECGNCHNKQDVVATVTNVIQPATCTEDGKQTYTATATPPVSKAGDPAPAAVSEDKVIAIPATGHHWYADASVNGNGWTWQEDGSGATLSLKCDCGETLLLTAETSMLGKQDVTCTEDGYTTYKGTLSESVARTQPNVTEKDVFDGVVWESTVQLQHIDALGHSWVVDVDYADSDNGWSWSQDGDGKWSAVLHLVCEHDGEHTMNVNAKVVAGEKTYPDCVSDGTITYTASVNLVNDDVNAYNVSAEEQTSQHVETIAPRGHSWVLDTDYTDSTRGWNWYDAANSVVAHFECEHDCGTALDVTVTTDNEATYTVSDRHGDVSLTVEVSGSIEVTKRDGTCTVGGGETRKVTINLEGSTFSNEHIVEERSPLGHIWVADTVTDESWQEGWEWTYSDDEWHATLHLRCERCGELLSFDGTVVAGTRKDPTCTAEGSQEYTAVAAVTVEFDGTNRSSFTETLPATGHKFVNEPVWNWNVGADSHYTVTATFTCSQCEATLTVVADTVGIVSQTLTLGDSAPSNYDVSGKIVVEAESTASCTEEGVVSLSVLLQVEGNSFSTSYRQENAVLGHVFDGEPEHHNVDGRHFHTYTCTRCGEGKLEEDCTFDEVVTEPTCEDDGYTTFTCARCGYSYTESGASATGHDYYVVWGEWNSETHTVEAELKCSKCEFSYKPEVTVTAEMLSPACEEDGERTYKASFVYDGTTYENENVLTETVPATGHNWTLDVSEGKSGWTWERDPASDKWTAKAHFKCTNDGCDEKQTLEADVNVKSQPATCTSDRLDILDARVSLDGVVYTASYTEYIEGTKTDHVFDRYVHVEEGGVHKHEIRCSICNELQKTEECTFETDKSDPTCTSGGYTRQKCTECGYVLSGSEKYFDAKGHAWTVNADAVEDTDGTADGWLWQLNEDGSYTVTVYLVCPDCGLEDSAVASVDSRVTVAPTCELQGTRVYMAVASKDGKEFTAELSADIPVDLDAHVWELDTDYPDSENGWIWTETDGKWTATAHFVCKNGCEATRSETDEEPDEVRTGEGSCTNPHTIVYTAEVVVDGQSYISTKVDYVAAESHNWIVDTSLGDDGWSWVGDPENGYTSASVHLKCTKCNDVQTVPTVITTNTIPATCQEGAYIVYTAYATLDGSPFYQSKQGARGEPSETHSWTVWTETKTPDCTNKGEEQRTCTVCGKTETRDIPARGHVWSEWTIDPNGKTESRHCQNCDVIETKVIGGDHLHVWSEEPTWQWSDDHSAATATFTCSICGNREIVDATVTSEDKGDYTTFTAMVEFEGETYSIKIDIANAAPSDNTDYGDFGPAVVYIFGQIIILIVAAIVLNRKNKKK